MAYPYLRSWALVMQAVSDTAMVFSLGRRCLLRCLLAVRRSFERDEVRYLLNTLCVSGGGCAPQAARVFDFAFPSAASLTTTACGCNVRAPRSWRCAAVVAAAVWGGVRRLQLCAEWQKFAGDLRAVCASLSKADVRWGLPALEAAAEEDGSGTGESSSDGHVVEGEDTDSDSDDDSDSSDGGSSTCSSSSEEGNAA